ncbi:MAG: hypothetical protein WDN03_14195 [Rhizomicrobium sp.]
MRKAIVKAENPTVEHVQYDPARQADYNRALAFMKMTAKLGTVLARLNSHHSSTVHVHRTESGGTLAPKLAQARSRLALEAAKKAGDEEYWERWTRLFHDETARADAAIAAEEGDPPPKKSGSNGGK